MPVNMRASSSVTALIGRYQVPEASDHLIEFIPRLLGNQALAILEKLLGLDLVVHGRATALVEMFEHADQEMGYAPQDLITKAIEPVGELFHPQEVGRFNEGRLDRNNLVQMVLLAVVSMILDDRGRLLPGLEIGCPRGIDPLCQRQFEDVLSDPALHVLQLEAVVGDVIFG